MRLGRGPILTAAIEVPDQEAAPHRIAIDSLPLRFASVDADRAADVRVVPGTPEVWPALAEAAIERKPRAVVIASRALTAEADAARLIELAARAGVVVAVATPFAGVRAWRRALGRIRREAAAASLVDSVFTWSGTGEAVMAQALLDHLAVVGAVAPDIAELHVSSASTDHYVVAGMAGRIATVLSGTGCRSDAPRLQLDIVGTGHRWRATFDGTATARPTVVERHSGDRIVREPLGFESGYRAAWIDLYKRLTEHVSLPDYLSMDGRQLSLCRRLAASIEAGRSGSVSGPGRLVTDDEARAIARAS
jgi:hypothetical protein